MGKVIFENGIPLDADKLHEERQVPKEHVYIGSDRLKRGHKMFKFYNGTVSECSNDDWIGEELKIKPTLRVYTNPDNIPIGNYEKKKPPKSDKNIVEPTRKLRMKENTIYRSALNLKNAVKIFKNMGLTVRIIG